MIVSGIDDVGVELSVIWHASARAALSLTAYGRAPGVKPRSTDCYHAHIRYLRLLHALGEDVPSDALGTDAFVRHYLTRPFPSWFHGHDEVASAAASVADEAAFPLLCVGGADELYPYDAQLLEDVNSRQLTLEELEEDAVFRAMRALPQDGYIAFRRFEIENPLLRNEPELAFRDFVLRLPPGVADRVAILSKAGAEGLPRIAYEPVPDSPDLVVCPRCGWTYDRQRANGAQGRPCTCVTSRSVLPDVTGAPLVSSEGYRFRLRWGPMQWHCIPGMLEVELCDFARGLGLVCELWPNHDFCDLKVETQVGPILADVKVYCDVDQLASHIAQEVTTKLPGILGADETRFYFVIPTGQYASAKRAKDRLNDVAREGTRVVDDAEFRHLLRMAAAGRTGSDEEGR